MPSLNNPARLPARSVTTPPASSIRSRRHLVPGFQSVVEVYVVPPSGGVGYSQRRRPQVRVEPTSFNIAWMTCSPLDAPSSPA